MIEGRAARRQERRAATPMPPEATREQVGQTLGAFGNVGYDLATAFPRGAANLTQEAMTNVPGQDPRYLTSTIGQAAQVASTMPSMGGVGEIGLSGLARQQSGTDIGAFKMIPRMMPDIYYTDPLLKPYRSYDIIGHQDEPIAQATNVKLGPEGNLKLDLWGNESRQSPYPPGHPAREANRLSHAFTGEEIAQMAAAALREYPTAKTAEGLRISGSRSKQGPASRGKPMQRGVPLQRLARRAGPSSEPGPWESSFPESEFNKDLLSLALESINQKQAQANLPLPASSPALDPTAAARQRAGLSFWANPEMSRIEQHRPGLYTVYNADGLIMAQGASRNEAIANAERLGAIRPPVNTIAHERMFGMSGNVLD